jgi:hypothetical protein
MDGLATGASSGRITTSPSRLVSFSPLNGRSHEIGRIGHWRIFREDYNIPVAIKVSFSPPKGQSHKIGRIGHWRIFREDYNIAIKVSLFIFTAKRTVS